MVSLLALVSSVLAAAPRPAVAQESLTADPHYTPAGFFDIHVCNWPDRPLFFLMLFSTERFREVEGVEVVAADGRAVGSLDPQRFIRIERPGKAEKRVFLQEVDVPPEAPSGWYTARVRLRGGEVLTARDYVIVTVLPRASGLAPGRDAVVDLPVTFSWAPVAGAAYYQVYVRDLWGEGEKLVHQSKLLRELTYRVPDGVLEPDGAYAWKVHARDVDEHVLLGDYNHGSQSEWVPFAVTAP